MINHKTYQLNTKGRDFVVGDIHGCLEQFNYELDIIEFDYDVDRMFSVGDLIDRGPDSLKCLELIEETWFHAVRGNHEDMMIRGVIDKEPDYMHNWIMNGGQWYHDHDALDLIDIITKASELPYAITVETLAGKVGICHAEPFGHDWKNVEHLTKVQKQKMIWGRDHIENEMFADNTNGVIKTIHGHTPIKNPKIVGNALFIDTGAFIKERAVDIAQSPYSLTIIQL